MTCPHGVHRMPQISYSLRQLRYFAAAVEHGRLSAAARRLRISQSAISEAVKALEEGFGSQLLMRDNATGISLTPAGTRFHRHALRLLREASQFEAGALADTDALTGEVDIACSSILSPFYMPRIMAEFQRRHPGVRLNLVERLPDGLKAALTRGEVDVAITYDFQLGTNVDYQPMISRLAPRIVLPARHRLAGQRRISLAALVSEPFILLDFPPSDEYFLGLFEALRLAPQIAHRSRSLELVRGLVGQGLGYSVLMTRPAGDVAYDGSPVVARPLTEPTPPVSLVIAWPRRMAMTGPAKAFVDFCVEWGHRKSR